MIGKGWKIPEPKPNANGSLVSFGTSSADLVLNSVSISAGASVSVTAFTYTENKG